MGNQRRDPPVKKGLVVESPTKKVHRKVLKNASFTIEQDHVLVSYIIEDFKHGFEKDFLFVF